MMSETLNDITRYIDFLRSEGYSVTLSCFGDRFGKCLPVLLAYEVHLPGICSYLKTNEKMGGSCYLNKHRLQQKKITAPYYACCYAGVEEYIFPVIADEITVACIHFSGYRGKLDRSEKLKKTVSKRCDQRFEQLYSELSDNVPSISHIAAAARPLEYMIERLYTESKAEVADESSASKIFFKAVKYIYENYMNSITCESVAQAVNYSESYVRHIFASEGGCSIAGYINKVRLAKAEEMLRSTSFSVTDIAGNCGFGDANYFSTAFSRKYGLSPRKYRQNCSKNRKRNAGV